MEDREEVSKLISQTNHDLSQTKHDLPDMQARLNDTNNWPGIVHNVFIIDAIKDDA